MNSLEFIKQHVTEWPSTDQPQITNYVKLLRTGTVMFGESRGENRMTCIIDVDLSEHFAPDYYDGKVWTREEFEACGKQAVPSNKYKRELTDRQGNSATIDVYDVLQAFNVTCPATQHAVKKLLCTGIRGHKDGNTDLLEARESITRAIELRG